MPTGLRGDVKNSRTAPQHPCASAPAKGCAGPSAQRGDPLLASMKPEELRHAMEQLGCPTQIALARSIGVDRSTVSLWLEGRVGVPRPVAKLLRLLVSQELEARRLDA